jgi:2-dehydro-3-deoxygluconokinase
MTGRYDAATFGEALAVFLVDDGLPLRTASRFRLTVAGAEANFAVGLATLGHRVRLVARVGDDALGASVAQGLRATNVDVSCIVDAKAPTGLLVRDLAGQRRSEVFYARTGSAGSRWQAEDVLQLMSPPPRVFYLSGVTPVLSESAARISELAISRAREAGALVVFDPNLRRRLSPPEEAARILRPLAASANVVVAGDDELTLLTGRNDPQESVEVMLADGANLVATKRGAEGAWLSDGRSNHAFNAFPVQPVDAVGAGDAFAAGLVSALLRERPLDQALAEACAVAACVVTTPGDVEGLPTAAERDEVVAGARGGVHR